MPYQYPQASSTQAPVKSSCKCKEEPITYAEAMRLIEIRFGSENAPIAKRNLDRMLDWYQRVGQFRHAKKS